MKNFLKIKSEDWKKERELGQLSFVIKRTIIFTIIIAPLCLAANYLLSYESEDFKIGSSIITAIGVSIGNAISEWYSLESAYQKSMRKEKV